MDWDDDITSASQMSLPQMRLKRPHIQLFTGDYLTYKRKFEESNQWNPICRICRIESQSISHILAICSESREKILEDILECVSFPGTVWVLKKSRTIQIAWHSLYWIQPVLT